MFTLVVLSGVPTTRALSLTMSQSATVKRAWYESERITQEQEAAQSCAPSSSSSPASTGDTATLKELEKENVQCTTFTTDDMIREHPDVLVREKCAILCRAAPSFLRVGHVELYARRAWSSLLFFVKCTIAVHAYVRLCVCVCMCVCEMRDFDAFFVSWRS